MIGTKSKREAELAATPVAIGNPEKAWASDVIAECIRALDIPYIALVPGASFRGLHDSIVNYLGNTNPQMVVCLHEEHAVAIADGYARVTDKPMAVALHSNVGLMHATMTIFNAWCDRKPMLIFGATGPLDANARRPWIDWIHTARDQAAMIRHFIKWDDQPASPEAAIEAVLRSHQIATTRPMGPVYVCLDAGMQEAPLTGEAEVPDVSRYAAGSAPAASSDDTARILDAVGRAQFPIVLMGRVSRDPADWEMRVRMAEAMGALVMTSLHSPPAFPIDHPLHMLPICDRRPTDDVREILARADLILSFDWVDLAGYIHACLGTAQTQEPTVATVIQCSLETTVANGWSMDHQALPAADINILAGTDTLARQLLERLNGMGHDADSPLVSRSTYTDIPEPPAPPLDAGAADEITPALLGHAVAAIAREHKVSFASLPRGWPRSACRFDHPLSYLGKAGGGAVGIGPGHTIGVSLALKGSGRMVIGVIGDGDFLMGVNALWTASNMELPLILVVANNRAYYNDVQHQERVAKTRGRPVENKWIGQALDTPRPDLAALARAQGFEAEGPVTDPGELGHALSRAVDVERRGGRYLIDVHVTGY